MKLKWNYCYQKIEANQDLDFFESVSGHLLALLLILFTNFSVYCKKIDLKTEKCHPYKTHPSH